MDELFDILKLVIIISSGLGLGFLGTSLIYAKKTKYVIEQEPPTKQVVTTVKYVDKYKIDLSCNVNVNVNDHNMENAEYRTVYEYTPNGGIFLKYNKADEIFEYWGSNSISYEILCVSIRKYCVQFLCSHLYQDSENAKNSPKSENKVDDNDQDLFLFHVKPQNTDEKKVNDISGITKHAKPKLPRIKIRCVGSIEDYDILTGHTKTIDDSTEVISWSSFKKLKKI